MYGLVNRAIEQLVVSLRGEAGWQRVCARARVGTDGFVAMCPYDDDVTHRLVGAASEELDLPPSTVLEAFGEYWIRYTAQEGYGSMLEAAGYDLRSFLEGLDDLHGRVETLFPHMRLPRFRVEDIGPDEFLLHYASDRQGLAPMVLGLLRGLALRFDEPILLEMFEPHGEQGEAIFRIRRQITRRALPAQASGCPFHGQREPAAAES